MFPFYTPWKHQKTKGSDVFRGIKKRTLAASELILTRIHDLYNTEFVILTEMQDDLLRLSKKIFKLRNFA